MFRAYRNVRAFKKRSFRSRRKSSYKRPVRRVRKGSTRRATKRVVRREISRMAEKKFKYAAATMQLLDAGGIIDTSNIIRLDFGQSSGNTIPQTTSRVGRVGNKIQVTEHYIVFTAYPLRYDAALNNTPQSMWVQWFIMYDKDAPLSAPTPIGDGDWFYNGLTDATAPWVNRLESMDYLVNQAKYRILKQGKFMLGSSYPQTLAPVPAAAGVYGPATNHTRYTVRKKILLHDLLPKVQKFSSFADTFTDVKHGLWLFFLIYNADGTAAVGDTPVEVSATMCCKWIDV